MITFMTFMNNKMKIGEVYDNGDSDLIIGTEQEIIESTKKSLYYSLEGKNNNISNEIFSKNKGINTRIITALGFYGIYTIGELLLIDIDDFGKRWGVGKKMIKCIVIKINELNKINK